MLVSCAMDFVLMQPFTLLIFAYLAVRFERGLSSAAAGDRDIESDKSVVDTGGDAGPKYTDDDSGDSDDSLYFEATTQPPSSSGENADSKENTVSQ